METYCRECGAMLQENESVCRRCGTPVGVQSAQQTPVQNHQQTPTQNCQQTLVQSYQQSPVSQQNACFNGLKPYYFEEFTKIEESGEQYKGKFNICAFLFGSIWALVKGCWLSAIMSIVISVVTCGIGGVVYWFIFGFRGNYMYYCARIKKKQCIL